MNVFPGFSRVQDPWGIIIVHPDVTATVMMFSDREVEREKIYGLNVKKSVVSLGSFLEVHTVQ